MSHDPCLDNESFLYNKIKPFLCLCKRPYMIKMGGEGGGKYSLKAKY